MDKRRTYYNLRLLKNATRLAESILYDCSANRVSNGDGVNFSSFALLARIIRAAQAVHLLVSHEFLFDAKLTIRSLWDSFLDLNLIHSGTFTRSELLQMLEHDWSTDAYEYIKFLAQQKTTGVKQLIRQYPQLKDTISRYEAAVKWYKDNTVGSKPPMTWRTVPLKLKIKALGELKRATGPLEYTVRTLGNAQAHSRPSALREHVTIRNDSVSYSVVPSRKHWLYNPHWLAIEAFIPVIAACDLMINFYFLGPELEIKLEKIIKVMRLPSALRAANDSADEITSDDNDSL